MEMFPIVKIVEKNIEVFPLTSHLSAAKIFLIGQTVKSAVKINVISMGCVFTVNAWLPGPLP